MAAPPEVSMEFNGFTIDVDAQALRCDCDHGSCWERQNDRRHWETCECPKAEGQIALSVAPSGPFPDWDSVLWGHLTKAEALERIDQLRASVAALGNQQ